MKSMETNIPIDNSKAQTPETQKLITPSLALEILKAGNERFLTSKALDRAFNEQIAKTTKGQYPFAIILSCIDSRVPTSLIFDQGIGDIFEVCVAGNFVNTDILGSIEYACKFAGVPLVVVLGHTSCGAVKGACDNVKAGNLTKLLENIRPAVDATQTAEGEDRSSANLDFVNQVATNNVRHTVDTMLQQSQILNDLYKEDRIDIVKAMYDVGSGKVDFLD
jgi:carbonic anhydrase